jgi:[amino group carrier protein]-lysine/ornithine hydrolase
MEGFRLLRDLVAIPSPTGKESQAVRFLVDAATKAGFKAKTDRVGNFIAEAGTGDAELLFLGHIDTVPGHIPVRVEDETLWGRGSVDAKAPLVAFLTAAHGYLKDPNLRIRIIGAIDEEGDSRGAKNLDPKRVPRWVVIGEPSGSDGITLGYKGIIRGTLSVKREHHHGAHAIPSAGDELLRLWGEIGRALDFQERFEWIQGRLLSLGSANDGLTDEATATFALRLPPGFTVAATQRRLESLGTKHNASFQFAETMEPALVDKRGPLVAAYLSAIRAEGGKPRLKQKTGTADFNLVHGWWPTVPIVAYGPGDAQFDHTPQERIRRDEFDRGVRVNTSVIARLSQSAAQTSPAPSVARAPARSSRSGRQA